MPIRCSKCNAENPDTLKFCGECGTRLIPSESPQAYPTQTLETSSIELSRGAIFAGRYEVLDEIDSATEAITWARLYDRKLEGGLGDVVDDISLDVARQVRQPLGQEQLRAGHRIRASGLYELFPYWRLLF